jgi:hypothetical protein
MSDMVCTVIKYGLASREYQALAIILTILIVLSSIRHYVLLTSECWIPVVFPLEVKHFIGNNSGGLRMQIGATGELVERYLGYQGLRSTMTWKPAA